MELELNQYQGIHHQLFINMSMNMNMNMNMNMDVNMNMSFVLYIVMELF
jgi:hypothetical protein